MEVGGKGGEGDSIFPQSTCKAASDENWGQHSLKGRGSYCSQQVGDVDTNGGRILHFLRSLSSERSTLAVLFNFKYLKSSALCGRSEPLNAFNHRKQKANSSASWKRQKNKKGTWL